MAATVTAVSMSTAHAFSKTNQSSIRLVTSEGVEGDVHSAKSKEPNLRQVHLIRSELLDELREIGFSIAPGELGENITTRGLDTVALPLGTRLHIGPSAVLELTGLRNPCKQIQTFQNGLLKTLLARDERGQLLRKVGVLSIVIHGAEVKAQDEIRVELPPYPHEPLPVLR